MMQCPFCRAQNTKVVDSRLVGEGEQIRRRRECLKCLSRFTTYETVELSLPRLIKRDGRCVEFNKEKLQAGLTRALEKRPVRAEQVEGLLCKIISQLRHCGEREVETSRLGDWVLKELRDVDEVAYIRFASVYRRFQSVNEFYDAIKRLQQPDK